jgi:hypothetical protein
MIFIRYGAFDRLHLSINFISFLQKSIHQTSFTVMSYNVRLFNLFKWLDKADVPGDILEFINDKTLIFMYSGIFFFGRY